MESSKKESNSLTESQQAPVLAIDGPSGSGKGTISYQIANRLGWHLLDSGALYRLLALDSANRSISTDAEAQLQQLAENLNIRFELREGITIPHLDGEDVGGLIRNEQIGNRASAIAALSGVRQGLLERQKAFRQFPGLVADGRDMGTVVFPDAQLKIYLTASAEVRAKRRLLQLQEQGLGASLRELTEEIRARDERDMNRPIAPLKPADDAIVLDSSDKTIEQVVDIVWQQVCEKYNIE